MTNNNKNTGTAETMDNIKKSLATPLPDSLREEIEKLNKKANSIAAEFANFTLNNSIEEAKNLFEEIDRLQDYLDIELKDYNKSFEELIETYTLAELLQLQEDTDSFFYKAMEAAKAKEKIIAIQNKGREERRKMKEGAKNKNAIMEIKGGNYPIFSNDQLWNAFAPSRIFKMGTLDNKLINPDTGEIDNYKLKAGDLEIIKASDISANALILISACLENSVDNIREKLIESGNITFYVDGILKTITDDPRTLLDKQLNLDRKTAGAIYLENLFKPLTELVGQTPNGSRWALLNYVGYDAETDTMTISSPYIYQLWRTTQGKYFKRQENKKAAIKANKKPAKDDLKPLELNRYFKNKAYTEDPITLEIAIYITNVLLNAGNTGNPKKTEIKYSSIIENCPRLKERLLEIEEKRGTINEHGKPINVTANYNTEFRKIGKAFKLIQDTDKCDALQYYDFLDIQPAKFKNGIFEVVPPTKSTIKDKLTINWKRKKAD